MDDRLHDLVDDLAQGYRGAQVLFSAVRLGLFAALGDAEKDAAELAAAIGGSARGTRILADALVALGLLEKGDGRYRNGREAREQLLPESPRCRLAMIAHGAQLYARWGTLYDVVRSGAPVPEGGVDPRLARDERAFAHAMADVGRGSAAATVDVLDDHGLGGAASFLDVGGGPGVYAIEAARRHPRLSTAVLDRPETLEVAAENVRRAGLDGRVSLLPGDAFEADLGGPWDVVLVSNLLHIYPAASDRRLLRRLAAALAPGGRLALKDFFLDEGRVTPPGGALFAVNMLVSTEGGDCYTVAEATGWLAEAGLEVAGARELTAQSRLVVGTKA